MRFYTSVLRSEQATLVPCRMQVGNAALGFFRVPQLSSQSGAGLGKALQMCICLPSVVLETPAYLQVRERSRSETHYSAIVLKIHFRN